MTRNTLSEMTLGACGDKKEAGLGRW
ncbi:MAG: burhizin family lasso peptide precursor [Planctomycetota bacterium]